MEGYLKANAENRMVRRVAQSQQALYVAEGGIEWAKAHLLVNSGLRGGSVSLATGRVEIIIEVSGGGYKVTSEGHSGLAIRKIEELVQLENGKWVMKSYQELHS
jgi:type II secretory pathway component PulK